MLFVFALLENILLLLSFNLKPLAVKPFLKSPILGASYLPDAITLYFIMFLFKFINLGNPGCRIINRKK